jgi:hypothetical protein
MRTARDSGTPVGVNLAAGAAAVVVAAMVAALVPAVDGGRRVAVLAVVVGGFAAVTADPRAVAGVGLVAWLVDNGFLVDRVGVLSWHGSADLYRAVVLAAAGGAGLLIRALVAMEERHGA